jgi:predicted amidohydrolase YtcJ
MEKSISSGCTALLALCLTSCDGGAPRDAAIPAASQSTGGSADTVLLSGSVYTVDGERSWAQAVAIAGRDIVYVGDDAGAQAYIGPATTRVDLAGRMLLPGFHDSHLHAESASVFVYECNLSGLSDKKVILAKLSECATADTESSWVRGAGWIPGYPEIYKEELDGIVSDRPVYVFASDGHHALVNSRALELLGIDAQTPDPPAGIIHRHANGEASGLLIESAMWLPAPHLPSVPDSDRSRVLRRAMEEANRAGITSIVEAWETPEWDSIWRALRRDNALSARVTLALLVDENWDEDIDALLARRFEGDEWLQATQIKLLVDGVTENQTAALKAPYIGHEGNRGLMYFSQDQLDAWIPLFESHGFQIHAHTLGDRSLAAVLDSLEKSRQLGGRPNDRPSFIHCYLIDPADYPRLRAADATLNFTMLWRQMEPAMVELNAPALGPERLARLMPMAEAAEFGLVVTGGSDWYVSQIDPLASIAAGLTGRAVPFYSSHAYEPDSQPVMPGRRPSLETLIAAYTINGAYASKTDEFTGSIEVGKRADLVLLDQNLFEIPAEKIYETEVLATLVDGRVVYGELP